MKKIKTSQNQIKESRKGLQQVERGGELLRDDFEICYDKEYPKNHILKGLVQVYYEKVVKNVNTNQDEVVEILIFQKEKVITSNPKRELAGAQKLYKPLLDNKRPGRIVISNCKVFGKASISKEFLD